MKKITFQHFAPHLLAIAVFLLVTIFFFRPVFFDYKSVDQHDINQFVGGSKTLIDYRQQTGQEGLWASNMFSGMPAYLVSLKWSNEPIAYAKNLLAFFLPSPVANIFLALLGYYILLLAFRVRPYLAMAGAIAFGFSTYMIVGLAAGHNARIGAIAFMPWVMAGIHLAFTGKRVLGAGLTALALALHLRENHLQITYYLLFIAVVYGLVYFVCAFFDKRLVLFFKSTGILLVAALLAIGTFFGQFWSISEYSPYSIRGASEIVKTAEAKGLSKNYAFEYSNGIAEPLTLLVPRLLGGASGNYLAQNPTSHTYQALVSSGGEEANQLAQYTSAYWGPQPLTAPYYAGAILCFLFIGGLFFAPRRLAYWLFTVTFIGIVISWGDNFRFINYFLFDHFPGFNKFRSVTFAIIIPLFAIPLLGLIGLENLFQKGLTKETKRKLIYAFLVAGGLCLLMLLISSYLPLLRRGEENLPEWLTDAMRTDRASLLRSDAMRSLAFMAVVFGLIWFNIRQRISEILFGAILVVLVAADVLAVSRRNFGENNYRPKRENAFTVPTPADEVILRDKTNFRVLSLQGTFNDARTSYFHHSIGGYHGAKMRRYQDLYDSAITVDIKNLIRQAQTSTPNFNSFNVLNMLNTKYIVYGDQANEMVRNNAANGNAWFVRNATTVNSPAEELSKLKSINTKTTAVIDGSVFNLPVFQYDSASHVKLEDAQPATLKYSYQSPVNGLIVFSEIYYPKGWHALIDNSEVPILRTDYVLRALAAPSGNHTIEFRFEPKPYTVGNKVTQVSSWLTLLFALSCIAYTGYNKCRKG